VKEPNKNIRPLSLVAESERKAYRTELHKKKEWIRKVSVNIKKPYLLQTVTFLEL